MEEIFNHIDREIQAKSSNSALLLLRQARHQHPSSPYLLFYEGEYRKLIGSKEATVVLPYYKKAAELLKNDLKIQKTYAISLSNCGHYLAAIECFRRVLRLDAENIESLETIAGILFKLNRIIPCAKICTTILSLKPNHTKIYELLGDCYTICGRTKDAAHIYETLAKSSTGGNVVASKYLAVLNNMNYDAETLFEHYQKHRTAFEPKYEFPRPYLFNMRKMRVGFISPNFNENDSKYLLLLGLFEFYDRDDFEFYIYSDSKSFDFVSKQFQRYADSWEDVSDLSDEQLADKITADKITILVDLLGHIEGNRICTFGFRPAPVQVSYSGHFLTTGLKSIDYKIVNRNVCSPDMQLYYTEKLHFFPMSLLNYTFPNKVPYYNPDFFWKRKTRVFGVFCNPDKITPETIDLWAKVLKEIPTATLLIRHARFSDVKLQELFLSKFMVQGVNDNRVRFGKHIEDKYEYLEQYQNVDICLDSVAMSNYISVIEAALLGVPTITLRGKCQRQRIAADINKAIGLQEFIAEDENAFVAIAKKYNANAMALANIKQNMREKMSFSDLCDSRTFAKEFCKSLRTMKNEIAGFD